MIFRTSANGNGEAKEPDVMVTKQPMSFGTTGIAMVIRAMGIDPAALTDKLFEFEEAIKSGLSELIARSKTIDTSLAELKEHSPKTLIDAMCQREERMDKNLESISAALSDIAVHLQSLEQQITTLQSGPIAATVAREQSKAKRKLN